MLHPAGGGERERRGEKRGVIRSRVGGEDSKEGYSVAAERSERGGRSTDD